MAEETHALALLAEDHRRVEALFARYEQAQDVQERTRIVHEAVHELAVHGEVEELLFYPRVRSALEEGERAADEAIHEHVEIKQTLNALDGMTAADEGFDDLVRELMTEVRHHVEEEEGEIFPRLASAVSEEDLDGLGMVMRQVRSLVPSRPHPSAPTDPAAKLAVSPPVALVDRVRDAIRSLRE